jgi:hypothetical protein
MASTASATSVHTVEGNPIVRADLRLVREEDRTREGEAAESTTRRHLIMIESMQRAGASEQAIVEALRQAGA